MQLFLQNVFVKKHGPIFLNSLFFYIKSVHYFLLFSKFNFSKFRNMYCFFKIFTICFILNLLILQTCLHFVFLLVKMQKKTYTYYFILVIHIMHILMYYVDLIDYIWNSKVYGNLNLRWRCLNSTLEASLFYVVLLHSTYLCVLK